MATKITTNPSDNTNTNSNNKTGKIKMKIAMNKNQNRIRHYSPYGDIGGFRWFFTICPVPKEKDIPGLTVFNVELFCEPEDTTVEKLWMCKAEMKLTVKQLDGTPLTKCGQFFFFNALHNNWGDLLFNVDWKSGVDLLVELDVTVGRHNLHPSMPTLETDLQLLFNDKKESVPVNKFILAGISSYFRNLFFGNWSERAGDGQGNEKKEFSIIEEEEDFDVHAFKLMLYSAMAMGSMVHESMFLQASTVVPILKLSVKYDVPMLQDYCQKYLVEYKNKCPKMEFLDVAEQLGLQQLKDHCLATIKADDVAENFVKNAKICARLGKRTQERLEDRLNESAKKIREHFPNSK